MIFYGIWLNHSHAFLLKANEKEIESLTKLESKVEPHHHSGEEGDEHLTITNQWAHNERRKNEMHEFIKKIVDLIKDANGILIFGPSNAKFDLKNQILSMKDMGKKILGCETTDSMSENQMKAYVREFFEIPKPEI